MLTGVQQIFNSLGSEGVSDQMINYIKDDIDNYSNDPRVQWFIDYLRRYAGELVTDFWLNHPGMYVCGGFVRYWFSYNCDIENDVPIKDMNEEVLDIDFYFNSVNLFDKFIQYIKDSGVKRSSFYYTDRAITVVVDEGNAKDKLGNVYPIQAIKYVVGDPISILQNFDFTICKVAVNSRAVFMHEYFEDHLYKRLLRYTYSALPLASLKRAFKYQGRGFRLLNSDMLYILDDIYSKVDFSSMEEILQAIESFDPQLVNAFIEDQDIFE